MQFIVPSKILYSLSIFIKRSSPIPIFIISWNLFVSVMRMADVVFESLENAPVFERYESLPSEVKFKVRTIRRWGFDLAHGTANGEDAYFLVRSGKYAVGDEFEESGVTYKISEILGELPPKKRIRFRIDVSNGIAYVVGFFADESEEIMFTVPAVALFELYAKNNGFRQLWDNVRSVGRTVEIEKRHGERGKSMPLDAWPGELRDAYRRLKNVVRDVGFGRIVMQYFGKSEDGKYRYRLSLILPTLALLDEEVAQDVERALRQIPDY